MSYMGGKGAEGTAQVLINQMPPHDSYVEPFAGHAAVYRAKQAAFNNTLIDRDPEVVAWLSANVGGACNLVCSDSLKWLRAQTFTPHTLIYCDPPYPIQSRSDPRGRYKFEMTDEDHAELLGILSSLPAMVMVSSYANKLYSSHLRDWRHITFESMTRQGKQTEHLWMSYPEPKALHDYSHLGSDYRERERIKRKVQRWTGRLKALPRLERLALYSAMAAEIEGREVRPRPEPPRPATPREPSKVAVLFCHATTNYRELRNVDVYDADRDARTFAGGSQVVAHPPCAQWGRLRGLADDRPEEKALGPFAVAQVRRWGGVLEHPAGSALWPACGLPAPGETDGLGGFTLDIDQVNWGHPAQKHTWLYVCGLDRAELPAMPAPGHRPTHYVTSSRRSFHKLPALSKRGRELTPPALAAWLVELARLCKSPGGNPAPEGA